MVVTGAATGLAIATAPRAGWATDAALGWAGAAYGADPDQPGSSVYGAAGVLGLDELVEPAATRAALVSHLGRLAHRQPPEPRARRLSYWSTS
jgi:hypothetical protein